MGFRFRNHYLRSGVSVRQPHLFSVFWAWQQAPTSGFRVSGFATNMFALECWASQPTSCFKIWGLAGLASNILLVLATSFYLGSFGFDNQLPVLGFGRQRLVLSFWNCNQHFFGGIVFQSTSVLRVMGAATNISFCILEVANNVSLLASRDSQSTFFLGFWAS